MRRLQTTLLVCVLAGLCASCGGAGGPTATPSPPANGLTLAGSGDVAGGLHVTRVDCSIPTLTGPQISVTGGTAQPGVTATVIVQRSSVSVRLARGSGATYAQRLFHGTGVTAFDAARGAQLGGTLSESPGSAASSGTALGTVTSIDGAVDCGGQQPGSTTITVSGLTADGPLSGPLGSARVECDPGSVQVQGLMQSSGHPVLLTIVLSPGAFSVAQSDEVGAGGYFTAAGKAVATVSGSGATVDGTAVAQHDGHSLHVAGSATCGVIHT